MIRLALIGCGEHSQGSHAVPLARYNSQHPGEISLVAACDLNIKRAEEFCRSYGFARAYQSLERMLAEENPDGCICIMPMNRITEIGIKLLKMKIPCVIEKPLGISPEDVRRLIKVAGETGTPHMVSVNRRFMPYLNRAISWAGEAGPLRYVRCSMIRYERRESDFIWATAVHAVDALRHIAGEIKEFKAEIIGDSGSSSRWYSISIQFIDGAAGQIAVLPTAGHVEESYELFGEGYRARVLSRPGQPMSLQCWRDNKLKLEEVASPDTPEDVINGAYDEVVQFVKALQTGAAPSPSIGEVFPSVQICFQIAERFTCNREANEA